MKIISVNCLRTIAAVLALGAVNQAAADNFVGEVSIIDGDTLEMHGTRIRLWGIDAPESTQLCSGDDSEQYRCGARAANDLDASIARRPVDCTPMSLDRYRRTVATCSVGGGRSRGVAGAKRSRLRLAEILQGEVRCRSKQGRASRGGDMERQLRGAAALQGLHPCRRHVC
jgi:hypothetical protein